MDENGDGTITSKEMKERLIATKNYTMYVPGPFLLTYIPASPCQGGD